MKRLFGTDGIRGVAGSYPLDESTLYACGSSLARQLERRLNRAPWVVSGRDTRQSGHWIEGIVAQGLRDQGAEVVSAGIITTPGIAFLSRRQPFDAGVVISASHNPVPDNGIKIFSQRGQKLDDELEQAIEADLRSGRRPTIAVRGAPPEDGDAELRHCYSQYLIRERGQDLDLSGLRLLIDCANGAAWEMAPTVFAALGADVRARGVNPNGKNINKGCGSVHIEALSQMIRSQSADVGIAFDGDADRVLLVGHDGTIFDGDHILFLSANSLKARGGLNNDLVVATVMSNLGLELGLQQRGISLHRAQVGDRYVLEKLLEFDGSVGGEQSGHIIFPHISRAGDGIITALEVLRIVQQTQSNLHELCQGLKPYPQKLINVEVKSKPPLEGIPAIAAQVEAVQRQLRGRGRLLLRYSGTENKARVMIEADDEALVETLTQKLAQTIRDALG